MAFYQKYQLKNGKIKWLVMYRNSLGKQYKKRASVLRRKPSYMLQILKLNVQEAVKLTII